MAGATRICSGPCGEDVCPCTPRVCDVDWQRHGEDEQGRTIWTTGEAAYWGEGGDPGYALDVADDTGRPSVMPCVYGQLGVRTHRMTDEPEPRRHHLHEVLYDGDTRTEWHEWADGDTDCTVHQADDAMEAW